jgi:hypothetical protein
MSNFLAVAAVTATLRRALQSVVAQDVSGATATSVRPDGGDRALPAPGVNIFLYQVTPHADWSANDLPVRRSDGTVQQLPAAALDLHYLLSFHGDDSLLETHRLLGSVTRTLHARPIITRQMVLDTITDPTFSYLAASDLADAIDLVRLVPLGLSLDEIFHLWSGLFAQTQYYLSVAYRASAVLLTATEETPSPALPVRQRQILVAPLRQPLIDRVEAVEGAAEPIVIGTTIRIIGRRLRTDLTLVRLAGQEIEIEPVAVTDTEIRLTLAAPFLDPDQLRAGIQALQVLHRFRMGEPATPRTGAESNVAPFVLRPTLSEIYGIEPTGSGDEPITVEVRMTVSPPVGARQRVTLLLNSLVDAATPSACSFAVPRRTADSGSLAIAVAGIAQGSHLVRLQVDDAESPLIVDADPASPTYQQYIGPAVELLIPGLSVVSVTFDSHVVAPKVMVDGIVEVRDRSNVLSYDTQLSVNFDLPDGSRLQLSESTKKQGSVRFPVEGSVGTYTLTVTDVSKEGYRFAWESSVLTGSVEVSP